MRDDSLVAKEIANVPIRKQMTKKEVKHLCLCHFLD